MLNLLMKDFKLMFASESNIKKRVVSILFSVFIFIAFVFVETFVFITIIQKIKNHQNAPSTFMSIFLSIVSAIMVLLAIMQARKLFFNKKDIEQLTIHPVKSNQIILSKIIMLFFSQYVLGFSFTFPLFVAYGVIFHKFASFFYLALFYPMLSFIFEVGLALLLVYPFHLCIDFLKKHLVIQFIVSVVIILGFCIIYGAALNIFMNLVAKNQIDQILNVTSIDKLIAIKKWLIPMNFLADLFILGQPLKFVFYLLVALGVFTLGLSVCLVSYNYFRNVNIQKRVKTNKVHKFRFSKPTTALIKKETILLFKNSNYIFSFTGLLIMQPFLMYLVISSMNTIFTTGLFAYYLSFMPSFLPMIDLLLIILFSLIISQGANRFLESENKNVRLMKTIPVRFKRQLYVKTFIPFMFSVVSLLISVLVLCIGKVVSFKYFAFDLIISMIVLFMYTYVSLYEELKTKKDHQRNYLLSSLYGYVLPLIYIIVMIVLSYFRVSIYVLYGIGLSFFILVGLPFIITFPRKVDELFLKMEVVN